MSRDVSACARRFAICLISLVAALASASCAHQFPPPPPEALAQTLAEEREFYKCTIDGSARLGIALSGGGMRSAAFAIGALGAIHQQEFGGVSALENVDVISSVSGGGYALSWYLLQQKENEQECLRCSGGDPTKLATCRRDRTTDLFLTDGRFQKFLERHGNVGTHDDGNRVARIGEISAKLVATIPTIPVHWFANWLFGWHMNLGLGSDWYGNGIERTFQLHPDEHVEPTNRKKILGWSVGVERETDFRDLERLLRTRPDLPYFVVSTAAHLSQAAQAEVGHKADVFELAPLMYGSPYFGYRFDGHPVSFNRAISISGAAFDSAALKSPALQTGLSALNLDLGWYIDNYNVSDETRFYHAFIPFPFYFAHHWRRDRSGVRIYLADGGHAENLGALALLRRGVNTLVIVDAEHDPEMCFEGYKILKSLVRSELDGDFECEEIEQILEYPPTVRKDRVGASPVFEGKSVEWVESPLGTKQRRETRVIYIKQSISLDRLDEPGYYEPTVVTYCTDHCSTPTRPIKNGFPHDSTTDQSYDKKQYRAYRDLGKAIVKNHLTFWCPPAPACGPCEIAIR